MRANLLLALILLIAGFVLSLFFFILVNIQIETEPFATWCELPYAGMFQYAGLVCLVGAIIYLFMERKEGADQH
jgi:hypothetical protein